MRANAEDGHRASLNLGHINKKRLNCLLARASREKAQRTGYITVAVRRRDRRGRKFIENERRIGVDEVFEAAEARGLIG